MVTTEGVLLPRPLDSDEDPADKHGSKPPRWCDRCEAGCSLERCWLCDGPTVALKEHVRHLHNPMAWSPELET